MQRGVLPFMGKLLVKKLDPDAILPTQAHPGEDLGFDIYALKDTFIKPGQQVVVSTGISAVFDPNELTSSLSTRKFGLLVKDRSGNAAKRGLHVLAGVIDAGYRGELGVVMVLLGPTVHAKFTSDSDPTGYRVRKGDKIAQVIPIPVYSATIEEVQEFPASARGTKGFGSSGH